MVQSTVQDKPPRPLSLPVFHSGANGGWGHGGDSKTVDSLEIAAQRTRRRVSMISSLQQKKQDKSPWENQLDVDMYSADG